MATHPLPWDPIWKYILDEESDDESTIFSGGRFERGNAAKKRVRFSVPKRSKEDKGSEDARALAFFDSMVLTEGKEIQKEPAKSKQKQGSSISRRYRQSQEKEVLSDDGNSGWAFFGGEQESREDAPETSPRRAKQSGKKNHVTRPSSQRSLNSTKRNQVNQPSSQRSLNSTNNATGILDMMKNSMFYDEDERSQPDVFVDGESDSDLWAHFDPLEDTSESKNSRSTNEDTSDSATDDSASMSGRDEDELLEEEIRTALATREKILQAGGNRESSFRNKTVPSTRALGRQRSSQNSLSTEFVDSSAGIAAPKTTPTESWGQTDIDRMIEMEMERSQKQKSVVGNLVCCSVKDHDLALLMRRHSAQIGAAPNENSTHRMDFPAVRMISEGEGSSQIVVGKGKPKNPLQAHTLLPPDAFVSTKGPQSLVTYEYETGKHADVAYEFFGSNPIDLVQMREFKIPQNIRVGSNAVVVKVEASTVSPTDCIIRRGEWWGVDDVPLPNTPGVDLVGKIDKIDAKSALRTNMKKGDRVLGLIKWGGNSRYAQVSLNNLVKVEEDLDPAQTACLAESYLLAFQAVHLGQTGALRYSPKSLAGKTILVVGGMSNTGRAVVELARAAGARCIYATAKEKQHGRLRQLGAIPLGRTPEEWFPMVRGQMDLVIDACGHAAARTATVSHFEALNDKGYLVFAGAQDNVEAEVKKWWSNSPRIFCGPKSQSQIMDRIQTLDVFAIWEANRKRGKRDLYHLLQLLQQKDIEPVVLDRISLAKVGRAHDTLEVKRLHGFLVCEPWIKSKQRALYL